MQRTLLIFGFIAIVFLSNCIFTSSLESESESENEEEEVKESRVFSKKQLMESFDKYTKDDKTTVLDLFLLYRLRTNLTKTDIILPLNLCEALLQ